VELVQRRIGLLFLAFAILLTFAAGRATYLGSFKAASLREVAATQQIVTLPVPARRGTITDRHGVELAVSEAASSVAANPRLIKDPGRVARRLASPLGMEPGKVRKLLEQRERGFVYLARQVPAEQARKVEKLEIEGIDLVPERRRTYPRRWLASQVLGTVGTDNVGLSGLELQHDQRLRGSDGERRLVRDALGEPISLRDTRPEDAGADLELTIDAAIQDKVEAALEQVGRDFSPAGATALVMDPRNSEVLALANWPRVDAGAVASAPDAARQNRTIGAIYEPGSTFKAFTVAGALEDGEVKPATSFNLPPTIRVADREIGESHERGPVTLTTAEILAQSSNVGAIIIGDRLGKVRFDRWVRRFGFGRPTEVDLPGEEAGLVPRPEEYSGSSMGNLPIGQGLSVTPLQMAAAYAAIANGGVLRPPRIVRGIDGERVPPPEGQRVLSRETATSVASMLEGVLTPGGTATEAAIRGYRLAGKTGTANKPDPVVGGYSKSKYVASFVGFAPAADPRLLVAVMVDEPKGAYYGGVVAAPAFKEITSFALPYLKIPPE
jgi:cell division protein FtsI (penicillin-binding protein 3)